MFFSYDVPGVKTGSTLGVTSWNNTNKEGRINFVVKMNQVSDPGTSWPSCWYVASPSGPLSILFI